MKSNFVEKSRTRVPKTFLLFDPRASRGKKLNDLSLRASLSDPLSLRLRIGETPIGLRMRLRDTRTKPSIPRSDTREWVYKGRGTVVLFQLGKGERRRQPFRFVAGKHSIFLAIGKGSFSLSTTTTTDRRWNMTEDAERGSHVRKWWIGRTVYAFNSWWKRDGSLLSRAICVCL